MITLQEILMARNHLVALLAAAGAAALVATSAHVYAADQEGVTPRTSDEWAQQQRRADDAQQPPSQGIGSTSGAPMEGSVQGWAGSSRSESAGPYEGTFLSPYEVRTPGPRYNIDD
jgi:hypothetical protein